MNTITRCYKILLCSIVMLFFIYEGKTQNCYSLELDHIGANKYIDNLQNVQACALKDSINIPILNIQSAPIDFQVLGYNLYPILGAVDEKFGLDKAFEDVEADLGGKNNYLAIVKYLSVKEKDEYSLVQEKVIKYKVYVDLPDVGGYEDLSDLEISALVSHLRSFLVKELNASNNPVAAEAKTMQEMWNYLKAPKTLDNLLLDLDFLKIEMPSNDEFVVERTANDLQFTPVTQYDNVYNYGGFVLNGETLEETLQAEDTGDLFDLTSSYYLAGQEINSGTDGLDGFYSQFLNDPSKVKLFIYFDFETDQVSTMTKGKSSDSRNGETRYCYYKIEENLSKEESEEILDEQYQAIHEANTNIESNDELLESDVDCGASWQFGRKCLYNKVKNAPGDFGIDANLATEYLSLQAATVAGFVDGFLGTIQFLIQGTSMVRNCVFDVLNGSSTIVSLNPNNKLTLMAIASLKSFFEDEENDPWEILKEMAYDVIKMNPYLVGIIALQKLGKIAMNFIKKEISDKFGGSAADFIAYQIGVVAFDAVLTGVTSGGYLGAKVIAKGSQVALKAGAAVRNSSKSITNLFDRLSPLMRNSSGGRGKAAYCTIGSGGCFVKDTHVLIGRNQFQFSIAKSVVVAAAMPIVAVPIQEVQLLDYALSHQTVNSTYGLTVSTDDDLYLGIMDVDPFTSDEQRERDKFEINATDWNEVVFAEINGSSTAKFALHSDWIHEKEYQIDAIVHMNLPEQGISGPFRITSIKHIIPQKKPADEDESDDYTYSPVTALFTHESNQVYQIDFENGEQIGVTYQHPIYSLSLGDWKLAGELEVGEQVLAKLGAVTVSKLEKKAGSEKVYNLEIKDLHNFLVGESGVVVHNSYSRTFVEDLVKGTKVLDDLPDGPQKSALVKLRQMYNSGDSDYQKFISQFSNGIHLELGENGIKAWKVFKNSDDSALKALKNDKAWLTRASKWMDEGAELEKIGGKTILRKGDVKILELKNGKILPEKYDFVQSTQKPKSGGDALGEASDGYQVYKHGDEISVRRMPDKTGYTNEEYKLLSDHPDAHIWERHGPDVTDDALIKRSGSPSTAPDGNKVTNAPDYSSKFESKERLKDALAKIKPENPNWNPPTLGNSYVFDYPPTGYASAPFGYGIPAGGGPKKAMSRVLAVYKKNDSGVWELLTMYPQI